MRGLLNFDRLTLLALLALGSVPAAAERVKDLASFAGVRSNQLIGFGLVVGLDRTGDQTSQAPFTVQALKNMLVQLGIVIPADVDPQLRNVAAVSVHAELPAFAKPGQKIDITVSSIANARSLRGGSLLITPLKGVDGQVYAIAQGNLVVGGIDATGQDGSRITINVPSVGRVPNGAIVEKAVPSDFAQRATVTLNLNTPDFTSAARLAKRINSEIGPATATALDAMSVEVRAPTDPSQRISYLAVLENLEIAPGDAPAKVIVNSRTGTVVIGSNVRVSPAAVAHGSLIVTIKENIGVSQPAPFSEGETTVVDNSTVSITEEEGRMFLFEPGVSLDEIVRAVNEVGAAPGDLVAILEALKQAGSLHAELLVI
ncbi:MAG: flagellar basal body P-ring protein FlgI [Pseudomonadota bacterium]